MSVAGVFGERTHHVSATVVAIVDGPTAVAAVKEGMDSRRVLVLRDERRISATPP